VTDAGDPLLPRPSLRWASPELSFDEGDQLMVLGPATDDPDASFEGESAEGAKGTFPKVRRACSSGGGEGRC